jgi:hypothetical protein
MVRQHPTAVRGATVPCALPRAREGAARRASPLIPGKGGAQGLKTSMLEITTRLASHSQVQVESQVGSGSAGFDVPVETSIIADSICLTIGC